MVNHRQVQFAISWKNLSTNQVLERICLFKSFGKLKHHRFGFIGSRCINVEGAFIGKEDVPGANVVISNSTKIIDIGS
jgi:hypothetical protein